MTFKTVVGIFLAISAVVAGAWYWQTQTVTLAPDATFTTIKGQIIRLGELKGKPALVTFWATDCPGCIEEIPHLVDLHHQFAEQGLTIVAVAMDYDPPNHVLAMAESKQLPYAVALDPDGTLARAFGNVRLTPTTFLIDRAGNIVLRKIGVFDPSDMRQRLQAL